MTDKTYLSCADTAKLLRKALKAEFPGQKFSVRSHTYAGGASIDVKWTDGPIVDDVRRVTELYTGASFDGMIDLKSYHDTLVMGDDGPELVSMGADFIFTDRELSQEFVDVIAAIIAHESGEPCDLSRIQYDKKWNKVGGYNSPDWERQYPLCVVEGDHGRRVIVRYAGTEYARDLVHRYAADKVFRS